jgi:hypothetical protein
MNFVQNHVHVDVMVLLGDISWLEERQQLVAFW